MKLSVRHFFDSAHRLKDTPTLVTKACARLHGHTYAVIVEIESKTLVEGMVVDFKAIKDVIDCLDHQFINDVFKLYSFNEAPTAENIAKFIHNEIKEDLGFSATVSICEGYKGAERASWAIYEPEA